MPEPMKRVRKQRPYYVLLSREGADQPWGVAFGDYDRRAVDFERDDYRNNYAAKNLHIIRAQNARQSTINKLVTELNSQVAA